MKNCGFTSALATYIINQKQCSCHFRDYLIFAQSLPLRNTPCTHYSCQRIKYNCKQLSEIWKKYECSNPENARSATSVICTLLCLCVCVCVLGKNFVQLSIHTRYFPYFDINLIEDLTSCTLSFNLIFLSPHDFFIFQGKELI